jgi:hypothetical protein
MPSTAMRCARGAAAGAVAAAVWAAQQPLDRRVFGVPYDDAELLGRWFVPSGDWRAAGLGLHLVNGALFGAVYAAVAPSLPVPPALRGPLAGLAEHVATWPGMAVVDRVHPARSDMPQMWGSGRAFAQSAWRHLLFGTVLGELERRLNPPPDERPAVDDTLVATNGHGSADHLVGQGI